MWLQQRLKGLPGLLSSSWARRVLIGVLLLLIFYWYLGAGGRWTFLGGPSLHGGAVGQCLQTEIHRWRSIVERGEGVYRSPEEPLDTPFVSGNGHILIDVDSNRLWVSSAPQPGSAPVLQTEFSPRMGVNLDGERAVARASMLWFRKGAVLSVRCVLTAAVQSSRDCVAIREEFMAHRSRPNVYLQRIHVSNPSDRTVTLDITSDNPTHRSKFSTSVETLENREVELSSGRVAVESQMVLVVVVTRKPTSRVQVQAKSEYSDSVLSVVWTSQPIDPSKLEETFSTLRDGAKKEMEELLRTDVANLVLDHQKAWMDLFISGVEMRRITDSHTPSSRTVNTTLYYILSSTTAPLLDNRLASEDRARLESSLNYADHCFSGHATMHAENLWPDRVSSTAQILQLVTLWTLTLQKRGCKVLVATGAHGAMQGMVLSFGGLQFTENHLQFQADPDVLHNSYSLRGIHYNQDLINLAVLLDPDGKPFLHVSVKQQETAVKLYACEAGCLNEPVELTSEVKGHTFPVMVTQPITPLLYISTDLRHLQDLRHTLHLKAILAHEEHMANRYPGLPFLFWFSVASLITLFHLFLFKLIYNEYCGPGAKPLFRSKVFGKREDGSCDSLDAP
uniref:KIAA2013 n=2 Tax=Nothobranchius kuhntae TaxID=321403 RepID=A0A1A8I3T5_NOTKU